MCGLDQSIKDLANYINVDQMLNAVRVTPFWVKDTQFRFLRYNQAMIDILYPDAQFQDLMYKTDWEYAKEKGFSKETVELIKEGCKKSDEDILLSNESSRQYFEMVRVSKGEPLWLLTTKVRIPQSVKKEKAKGIYGTAIIFPAAPRIIASGIMQTEKLTESCYRILG
jgi:hypothetical protein